MDEAPRVQKQHATFFRQSGWLMIANITGGFMSLGVHFLSNRVDQTQYAVFGTLLMLTSCLPAIPLQMLYAQQTASALALGRERELSWTIRLGVLLTTALWLLAAIPVFIYQHEIADRWQLPDVRVLWITLTTILLGLWNPIFGGALQGRQDFLWMGGSAISMGACRLLVAALLVLGLQSGATGMMIGALAGVAASTAIAIWRTRDLWMRPVQRFPGKALLRHAIPLVLGFWAFQFMFTSDQMFAQTFFAGKDGAGHYYAAGTLSRALLWLVLPLAAVMFPKLVHSRASSQKSNLLGLVVLGTALLSIVGGACLYLVSPLVVKIVYPDDYITATVALLPWYLLAMVPLALANVLINDLLASDEFKIVPVLVILVVVYGFTLPYVMNHVQKAPVVGAFNLLLLGASGWAVFTKRKITTS
jgi:O-antigen/teichoic acid export membrane protein